MLIVTFFLSAGLGSCSKAEPRPGIILFVDRSRADVEHLYALSPEGSSSFRRQSSPAMGGPSGISWARLDGMTSPSSWRGGVQTTAR